MFWQNNANLREQLCAFLSHFNVNMVEDKSQDVQQNPRTGALYSTPVHGFCDLSPTIIVAVIPTILLQYETMWTFFCFFKYKDQGHFQLCPTIKE
jgi:hypothetical protein